MKKIILTLLIFLFPLSVFADGMIMKGIGAGDYQRQSHQEGIISYNNGVQGMLLSVSVEEADEDMVWIFPVPSLPENVKVDISTKRPTLDGKDLSIVSESLTEDLAMICVYSQIWPILFERMFIGTESTDHFRRYESIDMLTETYDVEVHEHLEKEGMTLQLLTAKNAEDLYNYLEDHNLELEEKAKYLFDYYIGEEYSFIASWISSPEEIGEGEERGVLMQFPSADIFYPLLLTSIYDEQRLPISVVVLNYGKPQVFWDIKDYTTVKHYIASPVIGLRGSSNFDAGVGIAKEQEEFLGKEKDVKGYTRININALAKNLTKDLTISPRAPFLVAFLHFYSVNSIFSLIFLFLFFSIISGIGAANGAFRKELSIKERTKRGAKLGVLNIFSFLGVIIGVIILKENWKSKILFIFFFALLFIIISMGSLSLLMMGIQTIN